MPKEPMVLAHEVGHAIAFMVYKDPSERKAWEIAKGMLKPELWDSEGMIDRISKLHKRYNIDSSHTEAWTLNFLAGICAALTRSTKGGDK